MAGGGAWARENIIGRAHHNPSFVVQNAKLREENMTLTERLRFIEQELQHAGLQLQH